MDTNKINQVYEIIAFDADDTLWHNEPLFTVTQKKFIELLKNYHSAEWIEKRLHETQIKNLQIFGYGIKGFTLSMIETAIELTERRITGNEIQQIIDFAKEMIHAPIQLLDNVKETITQLAENHTLMLITKGDLFDQESKIARSGLTDYFEYIEIVSEKNIRTYKDIFGKYNINPDKFLMVGNSYKSDILPVLENHGHAIYIHYDTTWVYEKVQKVDLKKHPYYELKNIADLPHFLTSLSK